MVDLRSPPTARQLAVLIWIGDGCPDGVMHGHTYKTVASALQNRRLVTVSKKGGIWRAELTDAGRHYLRKGTYPPGHASKARPAVKPPRKATSNHPVPDTRSPVSETTPAAARTTPVSRDELAEQLVQRVLTAGGVLEVDRRVDKTDYEPLLLAAKRAPSLPFGKQLRERTKGRSWGLVREIYFDEDFSVRIHEQPVPVPAHVSKYHPAVAHYRDDPDRHEVTKGSLGRASRILHGLAIEAERRGYAPKPVDRRRTHHLSATRGTLKDGQLSIVIDGNRYGLRIREKAGPGGEPLRPTAHHRKPLPMWQRARNNTFVPTGQVSITIEGGYSRDRRPAEFRDTKTIPLEERLPAVLRELEIRALEDDWKQQQAERRAAEKRRQWEEAIQRAKHDLREAHRADILHQQITRWHTANELDNYLAAMRHVVATMTGRGEQQAAEEWLAWVTQYRATIDPLHNKLAMPPDPEPTPDALKPYLHGWSPYGPDGHP